MPPSQDGNGATRASRNSGFFDKPANALVERRELAKRLVQRHHFPLGEAHLRRAVDEYIAHYHFERNHQGLGNELLEARAGPANDNGEVRRKQRLGGLLSFYSRRAA